MSKAALPPQYLRGVELFNAGEYFACHEALEEIWLTAQGDGREFLHALIQTAAALHHLERGNQQGARSIYERAKRKFESLPPAMMGVSLSHLRHSLETFFAAAFTAQSCLPPLPQIQLQEES